jgi:ABC-type sugar transport system substrate-binding protein
MMNRRRFLRTVSVSLLAAPLAAQAQQAGKVYNIGFLGLGSSFAGPNRTAFDRGLQEHGWIEGRNFVLTTRFAQFKSERLREMVAELVRRKVDVIVVQSAEGALAAKHEVLSRSV